MPKILFVSPNGYLGGAEKFVINAIKSHQVKKNFELGVLFFSSGDASNEAAKLGLDVFILKKSFRMRNFINFFLALVEIRKIVIKFNPDILHLTMPYSHIALSISTFGLNVKKVWFQHGPVGGHLDKIANLLSVDMIWYNSHYLKDQHHLTWPKARVKIAESIISMGVETNDFSHNLFYGALVNLGAAGRICHGKGFHNLLIALGELKDKEQLEPYQLLIAGTANSYLDKKYQEYLFLLVEQYKLSKEVVFLNHVKYMESFYHSTDVLIHSAVYPEAFGLVVAEALGHGCLVVASNDGGVNELLADGKYGIPFCASGENAVNELKEILKKILGAKKNDEIDHYRDIASNGREFVTKNYSMEKMCREMEDLYFELLRVR